MTLTLRLQERQRRVSAQLSAVTKCMCSTDSGNDTIYNPEDLTPPIPPYVEKTGETTELKRARLLYQSRKRGMLENGLILSTFASQYLKTLTEDQLSSYDKLINQPSNDWDIYYWVTGVRETPDEFKSDVMDLLQKHARNEQRETRIRQPDL
ncbi:succinate dehydrogenase assembly factor 2, mitochondrial-like isoform X2 [Physella acuta]|uniref:succinate dehydrogenase assembly factor 2, mitochondrial-like isoform X2 n=1 Tax=Physella acuta TaxID=109671 RepID=UPI0027DE8C33|nr:succinate dehydrogenase assembly factor 2, mitochondrial-like isoform X2 [Physella acuta]